ncbi:MAG TPA: carboxypeptidase-like regulatory domain-containing protein [Candidatus Thermoplasmatota archaeon]|nr:carboxypeptidase-like regulatory domain-containing protein [Candidatus Thermoplasmatota archaeon]
MRWPVLLALALAASVALAGCSGRGSGANQVRLGDGTRISLDLPEEQQPEPDDIRGAVSGVVVNEAIFPVPGAVVAVRDRPMEAAADEDGKFVFEAMPPGLYTLVVRADGYGDGLGTINVRSGQVVKSILQVHRLPVVEPYHTTLKFEVLDPATDVFPLLGERQEQVVAFDRLPATVVLEAAWNGLLEGPTSTLGYYAQAESDPEGRQSGSAPNPLRVAFDSDFFPPGEYAIRFSVYPGFGALPPESRGEVFLTLFYVEPAPDGWSLVRGDS